MITTERDDGYRNFVAAIILQAVKDWRKLEKKKVSDKAYNKLRRFFKSEWANQLCDELNIDASYVLARLEAELVKPELIPEEWGILDEEDMSCKWLAS